MFNNSNCTDSAFASFMEKITNGKSGYKVNVIFCCVLAAILSVKGEMK
jgi:LIVCS family branched-chain amino acid:cation transporter